MNSKIFGAVFFLSALILISCEKPAGQGGTSNIKGKIFVKDFNSAATAEIGEFYGVGETVYISYGDDKAVGNSVKTGADGTFEFLYLNKGKYTVFAVSRDTSVHVSGSDKVLPVSVEVNITEGNKTYEVGDVIINQ